MNFLKGLALGLLSLLLFISLSIFGLVLMLNQTILNPDFVISQLNRLDISSIAGELLSQEIPQEGEFMTEAIDDAITDLEPWLKEQASTVIYSGYDYLMGRSQSLRVAISLEPMKEILRDNMREVFFESIPPELRGLPQVEVERYFDQLYQDFAAEIPSTFEFDESSMGPDVLAGLEQGKQIIGYIQLAYSALIGFMLLLILGIVLINRQVKGTTRSLGITFLTYGAFEYAGIFAAKYFAGPQLTQIEIPQTLQAWLPQFFADLLAPLEMFGLGLMIAGVVLIIVSIVYKPPEPSS